MGEQHLVYLKVKDFSDNQVKEIALRYANTPSHYTARFIAMELSRDGIAVLARTVNSIIQKAIKLALVSEDEAIKIRDKATYNSSYHGNKARLKTKDFYNKLIMERRKYVENGFEKPKKVKVTPKSVEEFKAEQQALITRLENSLKTVNHQIEIYEDGDPDISLEELLEEQKELQEELKKAKFYNV